MIFGLGVILYLLLSGKQPFKGANEKEIINNISSMKFNFPQERWKNISESAKNLISSMLCPEKSRISAKDFLNSKWLKSRLKKEKQKIISFDLDKIAEFRHFNKLKQSVLVFIASRLNQEEYGDIPAIFKKINECKTGMITFEDFKHYVINNQILEIVGGDDDEEIRHKFLGVDIDNNNRIDFTEFLAANMDKSIYLDNVKLRNAFDCFDLDKSRIIKRENIIKILKIEKLIDSKKVASDIIDPNDINKDGKIDFDEFCRLMKN